MEDQKIYSMNSNDVCINPDEILNFRYNSIKIIITKAERDGVFFGCSIETDQASMRVGCKKENSSEFILRFIADNLGEHCGWKSDADRDVVLNNIKALFYDILKRYSKF